MDVPPEELAPVPFDGIADAVGVLVLVVVDSFFGVFGVVEPPGFFGV